MSQRRAKQQRQGALPRYYKPILEAHAAGVFRPGTLSDIYVLHDDWCGKLKGGECRCNPDISVSFKPASRGA